MSPRAEYLSVVFAPLVGWGSMLAGTASALWTGGLPFVEWGGGRVMGHPTLLIGPVAFGLHLGLALLYGGIFALAIARTRGWGTLAGVASLVVLLGGLNLWMLTGVTQLSVARLGDILGAHLVFGLTFALWFKLGEGGELRA